ncbi:MAG: sugar phosphate isomerase/epimerase [bacterium]|nr:sugar phosphate isomerase/epimerase [bacterium]
MFRTLPADVFDKDTGIREKLRLATIGSFQGVEINIEEISILIKEHSPAYVKGMFDSFNLKAGIWKLPFSLDSEQRIYDKGIEKLENYARNASYLEAFRAVTYIELGSSKLLKDNISFYIERLYSVAKILNDYGCKIGIYFEHHKHFLPVEITRLCNKIKTGNAGFVLSARQWYLSGGEIGELKKVSKEDIVYVLVGDISSEKKGRYMPGETGIINIPVFLNTLADVGYDGPVSPEIPDRELLTIPSEIVVRLLGGSLLKVWKKAFTEKQQD